MPSSPPSAPGRRSHRLLLAQLVLQLGAARGEIAQALLRRCCRSLGGRHLLPHRFLRLLQLCHLGRRRLLQLRPRPQRGGLGLRGCCSLCCGLQLRRERRGRRSGGCRLGRRLAPRLLQALCLALRLHLAGHQLALILHKRRRLVSKAVGQRRELVICHRQRRLALQQRRLLGS